MDRSGKAIFNPSNHAVPWQQSQYDLLRSSYVAEGGRQMQLHALQTPSEIFHLLCKCLHVCIYCCFFGRDSFLQISSVYSEWLVSRKVRNLTVNHWCNTESFSGKFRLQWKAMLVKMSVLYAYTHMFTLSASLTGWEQTRQLCLSSNRPFPTERAHFTLSSRQNYATY